MNKLQGFKRILIELVDEWCKTFVEIKIGHFEICDINRYIKEPLNNTFEDIFNNIKRTPARLLENCDSAYDKLYK